jgi:Tfp pilus assembly protein PilF
VALAHLQLAQEYAGTGDWRLVETQLLQVLRYRPDDLYANYLMRALVLDKQGDVGTYVERLRQFSKDRPAR